LDAEETGNGIRIVLDEETASIAAPCRRTGREAEALREEIRNYLQTFEAEGLVL
jgi:hypothetical protein